MLYKTTKGSAVVWVPLVIIVIMLIMNWSNVFDSKGKLNVPNESVAETQGGKVYTNNEYGIQLQIPSQLIKIDSDGAMFAFADNAEKANLSVMGDMEEAQNLPEGFNVYVEQVKAISPTYKVISDEKIFVDGLESRLIKLLPVDDLDNSRYILLINNLSSKGVYMLIGQHKNKDSVEYDKMIRNSLLSFKLLK